MQFIRACILTLISLVLVFICKFSLKVIFILTEIPLIVLQPKFPLKANEVKEKIEKTYVGESSWSGNIALFF